MNRSTYVGIVLMLLLAVLQATVLSRFPLLGVVLQPALLAAVAWGLLRGPYEGLVWAFAAGLLLDLFSIGPLGATALALMAAVLLVTYLKQILPDNQILLPILLSGVGIAAHLILYTLILWIAGRGARWQILVSLPATMLLNALLSILVYWPLHTLRHLLYPPQIEL